MLDIYDYNEWRAKPEERKHYIKPTMDDFDQEIEYTWLFLLSIPTLYFVAAVVFYNQHVDGGSSYFIACDHAKEDFYTKAECEIYPLYDISVGTLVATQCSFIVCLVIYKQKELKKHEICGDYWCMFIYT